MFVNTKDSAGLKYHKYTCLVPPQKHHESKCGNEHVIRIWITKPPSTPNSLGAYVISSESTVKESKCESYLSDMV